MCLQNYVWLSSSGSVGEFFSLSSLVSWAGRVSYPWLEWWDQQTPAREEALAGQDHWARGTRLFCKPYSPPPFPYPYLPLLLPGMSKDHLWSVWPYSFSTNIGLNGRFLVLNLVDIDTRFGHIVKKTEMVLWHSSFSLSFSPSLPSSSSFFDCIQPPWLPNRESDRRCLITKARRCQGTEDTSEWEV